MAWFETPTPEEFKEKHHGLGHGCWKHPSDEIAYGVLVKMPPTKIRPKTAHQEKREAKENEIREATKRKKEWEQEKKN